MNLKFTRIVCGVLLILAVFGMPYGYYTFLRIFIFIVSLIMAYKANDLRKQIWQLLFIIIVIVFNPLFPLYLNKNIWMIIDLLTALVFWASLKYLTFERIITDEKYVRAKKNLERKTKLKIKH